MTKRERRRLISRLVVVGVVLAAAWLAYHRPKETIDRPSAKQVVQTGLLVSTDPPQFLDKNETAILIKQNYAATVQPVYGVSRQVIHYTSLDPNGHQLSLVAQVFMPQELPEGRRVPIIGFAPGTTGIGDQCAASLENPAKANWANYASHLAAYASQGFAVVMTDYEGMDDATRMHHYMVGQLEGRAVLDSVRALMRLPQTADQINTQQIVLMGYSQGGHAVFWADKIAADYAPDLGLKGVVGFGPVTDVSETWRDVVRGANINWFGPFVLASYADYYHQNYPISRILTPKWQPDLGQNVSAHCIDTLIGYWGRVSSTLYSGDFLQALANNNIAAFSPTLADELTANITADQSTKTAKLINVGALDNVVLPIQQTAALGRLCLHRSGSVHLQTYPKATHYNTMFESFHDTVNWINTVVSGHQAPTDCRL